MNLRTGSPLGHLVNRLRGDSTYGADLRRLREKHSQLTQATEQWKALLRDMEHRGETADPRYETYYRAYVQAREQEKRADLELFNIRRGLVE